MTKDRNPLLKVAVISDIQGYAEEYDWGMHNTELAFKLLAPKQPDVLMMGGDLADGPRKDAFEYYQNLVHRYFAGKIPVSVACAGNHDYSSAEKHDAAWSEELYRRFSAALEQTPDNPYHQVISGYDFIALSEDITSSNPLHYSESMIAKLDAELKKAVSRDPEKPVFVITHFLPRNTVPGSHGASGIPELRELFNQYPQVVSFSCHVHYPLEDERNIWQGEFTAVQTSSLSYACMEEKPFNSCNSIIPFAREAVQCLYLEIFADHLEIHRYNVEDQREIKPDQVWNVDIPYLPATARYTDARKKSRKAPEFPSGTQAYLRYDYGYLYLIFEQAEHEDFTQFYKLILSDLDEAGNAVFKSETLYVSNFYRLERNRDHRQVIQLPGKDLTPKGRMRAEIYPVESFGNIGKPLIVDFRNPCSSPKPGLTERPQE
ncbi:MAG: metallophosphoesterase [Lentisphaeria bacterium]|nr:metallophosphoesterase [Lentisphaeria bacterium]